MTKTTPNLRASALDAAFILEIASRARRLMPVPKDAIRRSTIEIAMDLTAAHLNGNPLRLKELLNAPDASLMHDVYGIERHLDRETGKLGGCFTPRFSAPEVQS